jgi:hypothetical protein
MQEGRHLIEQPLGRPRALDDDASGIPRKLPVLLLGPLARGIVDRRSRPLARRRVKQFACSGLEEHALFAGAKAQDALDSVGGAMRGGVEVADLELAQQADAHHLNARQ